mgnify:CR=1 FL=1
MDRLRVRKHLYIMRHGLSEGNVDVMAYKKKPDHKIELVTLGRSQSFSAGQAISASIQSSARKKWHRGDVVVDRIPMYVVCSPFDRARETFTFANHGFKSQDQEEPSGFEIMDYREDPRIREQDWGGFYEVDPRYAKNRYHGIDVANDDSANTSKFWYKFKDGESGAEVYDRSSASLEYHLGRFPDQDDYVKLFITHGYTMRVMLMYLLGLTVEEFETMVSPENCGFSHLVIDGYGNIKLESDSTYMPLTGDKK